MLTCDLIQQVMGIFRQRGYLVFMCKKIYAVSLGNIFQLQGLPLSPVNHSRSLHTPMDHSTLALFHKTGLFKKHA